MFVNRLCEAKGEQNGEADKPEESFCELVIASGDAAIALDFFEEVFYPVRTPVEHRGEWRSRSAVTASRNAGVYFYSLKTEMALDSAGVTKRVGEFQH